MIVGIDPAIPGGDHTALFLSDQKGRTVTLRHVPDGLLALLDLPGMDGPLVGHGVDRDSALASLVEAEEGLRGLCEGDPLEDWWRRNHKEARP